LIKENDPQKNKVTFEPVKGKEGEWFTIRFKRFGNLNQYAGLSIQASGYQTPSTASDTQDNLYPYENYSSGWHGDWILDQGNSRSGNRRLIFSPGQSEAAFQILLRQDDFKEESERINFSVSDLGDWYRNRTYQGNFLQDIELSGNLYVDIEDVYSLPSSVYSIGDVQGYEGDTLYALVRRTGNINTSHSLSLSASNGTAFSGFDFVAPSSTLSFAAGESSKLVGIRTIEDSLVESDESFTLTLSAISSGAVISEGRATLTIRNAIPIPFKTSISRTPTTLTTPPTTRSMSAM
jgi:hypothetical protein